MGYFGSLLPGGGDAWWCDGVVVDGKCAGSGIYMWCVEVKLSFTGTTMLVVWV